jgi:UDP-N-acetylmuramoylalanine--D-glutamate ligase
LSSFENIFWIAGGIAKSGGIEALTVHFPRITKAYLIGVAATDFAKTLQDRVPFEISETLPRAVQHASQDAAASGKSNAVVLLSPACASFDHYKNFEVRGDAFVEAVSRLPGVTMSQREA